MNLNIIAAVDENWGIGYQGRLLVQIPMDQKLFRQETMGKVVIMGRKTFESLPGQRPLDGRINIVLSTKPDFAPKGVHVTGSVEETLALLERYKQKNCREEDIFVVGGEQIYRAFLPYCDTAHITQIEYNYTADTHMVNLEESPEWEMVDESDELTYFDLIFYFRKYQRIHNE
jgi:dihydrofolate reductase